MSIVLDSFEDLIHTIGLMCCELTNSETPTVYANVWYLSASPPRHWEHLLRRNLGRPIETCKLNFICKR